MQSASIRGLLFLPLTTSILACLPAPVPPEHGGPDFADEPGQVGPPGATPLTGTTEPPRDLPGVETADLNDRERAAWWNAVNKLYAPCSDTAVSITQCIDEARDCSACVPAAQMLATRAHKGASERELEVAYEARFSSDVRDIDTTGSPTEGPVDAPVAIVVWHDFQCPACRASMPVLSEAVESHAPSVRIVHKFYPLEKHTLAKPAALAAIAAARQKKYWEFEEVLWKNQKALAESDLVKYAESVGIDLKQWDEDRNGDDASKQLQNDMRAADKAGLSYTPYILINGRVFDTATHGLVEDLDEWIETELALIKAAKEEAKATPAP